MGAPVGNKFAEGKGRHPFMDLRGYPASLKTSLARPSPIFSVHVLEEIISQHVSKEDEETQCWEWNHLLNRGGYGSFSIGRWSYGAHRLVYENTFGPINSSLVIDHKCCNKKCVNPAHLEAVSASENVKRGGKVKKHLRESQVG